MGKLTKAAGAGLKHFFGARESMSQLKNLGRQVGRADSRVKKAKILAVMGMYSIYKGSPIGLAKNVADSIKVGKWKYGDVKKRQQDVDAFLATTGMSPEGAEAVSRMMMNYSASSDASVQLSQRDAQILEGIENDLHIEAGHCVNF